MWMSDAPSSFFFFSLRLWIFLLLLSPTDAAEKSKKPPPPFFLQDTKDSLCLGGESFQRCSIDTLWYVVGKPGSYQIHKRPADGPVDKSKDDGFCLSKSTCGDIETDTDNADTATDTNFPVKVLSCSHCGSKHWNILGDSETGYVLTEGDGDAKLCVLRQNTSAFLTHCDKPSDSPSYTPLQLQFTSDIEIAKMSSPAARLMAAATDGDTELVKSLLETPTTTDSGGGDTKLDVNYRDWDDLTALIPAASGGYLEIVELLLAAGADVNAADKDGITALMEASILGHAPVVRTLLEHGATVEATTKSEVTALWLAAGEGQTEVMEILLEAHADAGNTRVDGITGLMTASVGGHEEAVRLLLEHGADPTVADKDGLTPLMNAAEKGNVECLRALAEGVDRDYLNLFSRTGFSALIIAAAHGHKDAAEFLIDAGADIDSVQEESRVTALMYAAASDHVDVLRMLLEKGAYIHFEHSNNGTALLEASTGGAPGAMKALLEAGSKVDFYDADGVTPLMAVASQGNMEGQNLIVEYLQKGMDEEQLREHINMASYSGGTSVMFAAASGHTESTQALIALGANVNDIARATPEYLVKLKKMIEDGTIDPNEDPHIDGVTALHVAAQSGHLEAVKVLIEHGADATVEDDEKRTPLTLAVKGNYGEVAKALVAAGADPNTPYVDEEAKSHNLLFDAIMVENREYAILLIEKGADIYFKDEKKVTTLLQASHRGLVDVVEALLRSDGGKMDYIDEASDDGTTPLMAASSEGHTEIALMLLDAKANIHATDNDGTTSLMAASARGHKAVVSMLLEKGAGVDDQNTDGHTALMFAYNGKNQVETLWERFSQYLGAESAGKQDTTGTGTLIQATLANHTALISMLLKAGADASIKDKEGHTAKDFDFHPDVDDDVLAKEARNAKVRDESKNEL